MTANASFLYYVDRDYGRRLDEKTIRDILDVSSNRIDDAVINGISYLDYFTVTGTQTIRLTTTYPGLIIGSGYNHPAGEREEDSSSDFQMGFYFDHTTGMPVIPGSTVKGILKSVFPKNKDTDEIIQEKIKYINGLLDNKFEITKDNWQTLFEKGNIFYDAFISAVPQDGRIFAEDYITPHNPHDPMGIFKNPTPLRFLKIAPGVTFTFQFRLKDSVLYNELKISISEKKELFKRILLDFGIGAKRNVGYGNFIE